MFGLVWPAGLAWSGFGLGLARCLVWSGLLVWPGLALALVWPDVWSGQMFGLSGLPSGLMPDPPRTDVGAFAIALAACRASAARA